MVRYCLSMWSLSNYYIITLYIIYTIKYDPYLC